MPVAAVAGVALPGCECGSVPIAGRLVARGVAPAAAVTFLLSAPAVNPVVLVATAVAFPGQPEMVLARFLASLLAACVVGFVWIVKGRDEWVDKARRNEREEGSRFGTFVETAEHDFLHAGGFLVIGAATAASLQTLVPRSVLDSVADRGVVSVLALAGLAVILAICSEADAFVAASLTQFSLTARLAFMVVGPMVDVKLVALQAGTFGRRFTSFFAPLTFCVAVSAAVARRSVAAVSTDAGATLTAVIGVLLTRLALEGTFRRYVRPGMGPWLAVAGVLLALLGVIVLWRHRRGDDDHSAHEHGGERVAWLLLAPVLALLLIAPGALGAYSLGRTGSAVTVRSGGGVFARLDPQAGPHEMSLLEFDQRAFEGTEGASFNGATVRLIGFVGPDEGRGVRRRPLLHRLLRRRRPGRDGARHRLGRARSRPATRGSRSRAASNRATRSTPGWSRRR